MKPQDIVFFVVLLLLLKRPGWLLWAGLGSFVLAMPLFAQWIFFTAERLTWYGSAFILFWLLVQLKQ
ncbi:hypothetical protein A2875_01355 [Candidatus Gottesmanbacteria bacterium RIFCSPHIGHO2_01_FULL_46_14]|uniref:Uncharacterized protein n=2 Tax=Candidatus Gottesmaniibacteriota TaxID=1752720 RepID=A0A1F5ZRF3_9BACT|nr:MAG: hypothetical protein A2875_01355 [Candidatus Gottesmanbacteria bacterium RIFCSPHIGHO2_01_FULL_46_14]OGG28609.1 MAG: hypothetical protein A2971_02805 [Candidatus Gottesmanbacteria bacterium RIFCSPLOWO2_01_FULL_46_21]